MTTGSSAWQGLGMGINGEYLLTQVQSSVDCFTIQGASTSGTGTLFTIQNSDATPAVNGLRVYDYGRTRIIRTDASAHGGAFKNALDVKYDLDYAAGAVQVYGASIILDVAGGSCASGRLAVLQLQSYGNSQCGDNATASWLYFNDLGTTEQGVFLHVGGSTIGSTGMLQGISDPTITHGLVMYWENTKYFICVADAST